MDRFRALEPILVRHDAVLKKVAHLPPPHTTPTDRSASLRVAPAVVPEMGCGVIMAGSVTRLARPVRSPRPGEPEVCNFRLGSGHVPPGSWKRPPSRDPPCLPPPAQPALRGARRCCSSPSRRRPWSLPGDPRPRAAPSPPWRPLSLPRRPAPVDGEPGAARATRPARGRAARPLLRGAPPGRAGRRSGEEPAAPPAGGRAHRPPRDPARPHRDPRRPPARRRSAALSRSGPLRPARARCAWLRASTPTRRRSPQVTLIATLFPLLCGAVGFALHSHPLLCAALGVAAAAAALFVVVTLLAPTPGSRWTRAASPSTCASGGAAFVRADESSTGCVCGRSRRGLSGGACGGGSRSSSAPARRSASPSPPTRATRRPWWAGCARRSRRRRR